MSEASLILGYAKAAGIDAYTQCKYFKKLAETRFGRPPENAYFSYHIEEKKLGLKVIYENTDGKASRWAEMVLATAPKFWDDIFHHIVRRAK